MKILVITPTFYPVMGGAEKGIFEIFSRLAEKHEVKILTPFPEKKYLASFSREDNYRIDKIEVLNFHDSINLLKLPGYWKLRGIIPPFSISIIFEGLKIAETFKPDVSICFYAIPAGLSAIFLKKIKKIPLILSLVGRDIPGPGIPYFWKKYVIFISKNLNKTIFISEFCRKSLGFDSGFGEVIPFGVDIERFKPGLDGSWIRKKINIPKNARVLFSIQRLDKWKRVDILIKAMKKIIEEMDAYLVIGGKGHELNNLVKLSKELSLDSRVVFTGYIDDEELPLFYAMADLFVFHSTYETLGLVLLEAMASGKPIVSVKSTAIPEVVEDGKNGILVEPLNPEKFANATIYLLNNPHKMEEFGRISREIAIKKFSIGEVAKKYEEILLQDEIYNPCENLRR